MSFGLSLSRILVLIAGICLVVLGIYLIALPSGAGTIVGIWTVLGGIALMVGALIERIRYRNEAEDRDGAPAGYASRLAILFEPGEGDMIERVYFVLAPRKLTALADQSE